MNKNMKLSFSFLFVSIFFLIRYIINFVVDVYELHRIANNTSNNGTEIFNFFTNIDLFCVIILPLVYFYLNRNIDYKEHPSVDFVVKLWGGILLVQSCAYIAWIGRVQFIDNIAFEKNFHLYTVNLFTFITSILAAILFIGYLATSYHMKNKKIFIVGLWQTVFLFLMMIFLPLYFIEDITNPLPYEFFWKPMFYRLPSLILSYSYFFIGKHIKNITTIS